MFKKISIFFFVIFSFIILNYIFYLILVNKFPNYIDEIGNINLDNLHFFFGEVIENLIVDKAYFFTHGYYGLEINYSLGRLPLIPLFLTLIIKFLSSNYLLILVIKNTTFFLILFYIVNKIFDKNYFLFISFILFTYNPHNIFTSLSLSPEEGYTSYLILGLFLLSSKIKNLNDIFFISILLFLIFLTKASMVYLCYSVSFFLIFSLKNRFKLIYSMLPMFFVLLAYLLWASFGYHKTQKFISPLSISTMSGSTLIVSSNKEFGNLYHLATPDPLEPAMWLKHKDNLYDGNTEKDEFEINEYFINESKNYIIENKIDFTLVTLKKLHVIFTNLKKDAQPTISRDYNKLRYSNIPNKLILMICFYFIIKNIFNKNLKDNDIMFLILSISFLFPYLIGWVYTRHVVPLYLVSHFYLLIKFKDNFEKFFSKNLFFLNFLNTK